MDAGVRMKNMNMNMYSCPLNSCEMYWREAMANYPRTSLGTRKPMLSMKQDSNPYVIFKRKVTQCRCVQSWASEGAQFRIRNGVLVMLSSVTSIQKKKASSNAF